MIGFFVVVWLKELNDSNKMGRIFFPLGERAMSPAQSEDSGLAADRGTTYATISLPRENAAAMGIVFLGKCIPTHKFIRKPQHFFPHF